MSLMKSTDHSQLSGFEKYMRSVGTATLAGAITTGVLLIVFALIMTIRGLPQSAVEPIGVGSAAIGCFVSGFVCGRITRQKALIYGAACGLVMYLIYIFIYLTINGQGFGLLALIRAALFIISAMLGAVIGVNRRKKRRL